jgi:hypothetical protein
LPPGTYRLRAAADGYQTQELYQLEVPVAGRLEVNLRLRPLSDVWEAGEYRSVFLAGSRTVVTFYGPDLDESRSGSFEGETGQCSGLAATLSQVIDPVEVRDLPLAGRDVYTMLLTQPGTTADSGTTRGLGLSAVGQRPSASNFMLDGLENNNYLVTGLMATLPPEAIQEYRVSTGNYSAEYGRTSGYLANAVTRSGSNGFHGIAYDYLKSEALDANGFQENRQGLARTPLKEQEFGFQAGGPIRRDRLFFSSALERLRSRSRQDVTTFELPSAAFASAYTAPGSDARKLMTQFPAPAGTPDAVFPWRERLTVAPPVSVDRTIALERLDYQRGSDRVMARAAINRLTRPDFIWSPYRDFISALSDRSVSLAATWQHSFGPALVNDAKVGYSPDKLGWDRPHPEIPTLASSDGVVLPGSSAFYGYRNHIASWQVVDSWNWTRGRHMLTFGGGLLRNELSGYLTAGRDGYYGFGSAPQFGADTPILFSAAVARGSNRQPVYEREYRYAQPYFFAQDSIRAAPRLTVNLGVRYEYFGAPRSVGAVGETVVVPGRGGSLAEELASATLAPNTADLYHADKGGWAYRAGLSYALGGSGRTVLHAGSGIFYDRPFDNLWQNVRNNSLTLPLFTVGHKMDFLAPVASVLGSFASVPQTDFPNLTMFSPELRNGYAQNYFYGLQQQVRERWTIEVNGIGSVAHHLVTTDIVNREFTTQDFPGRLNANLPDISYRSGQGFSNYQGLTASARYHTERILFQAAYTWSHAIDNQSEPLAGDFFDLSFTSITSGTKGGAVATFSRQFDPLSDRGASDFDQRHNLVFFSAWSLPWRLKFSQMAAFRAGFPYTVYSNSSDFPNAGDGLILNNRADRAAGVAAMAANIDGGRQILNPDAFAAPGASALGTTGRNAFRGPGLYNFDASLSRSFALPRLGEAGKATIRADAYNLLNHANLNNPDSTLGDANFGQALYGRVGRQTGFPASIPFTESARQVQVMLRIEW